jgi:cbb3-type cytochrome oxidase maturation protein
VSVLFVAVPVALLLVTAAVVGFLWAVRGGQLDDLETPALRILHDDATADAKRATPSEDAPRSARRS